MHHDRPPAVDSQRFQGRAQLWPAAGTRGPEWIQANDPSVQNHHMDDWWQVFGDPTLDALIVTAYEQNPTLRIAGTRVLQARAGQAIAVGNIFPQTQQAIGSYARVNLNSNMPLVGPLLSALPPG